MKFLSIDEYIATFPSDGQTILGELRTTIQSAAPDAKETISYNMPTFTWRAGPLLQAASVLLVGAAFWLAARSIFAWIA